MSQVQFKKLQQETDELIKLYTENSWSYHSTPSPSPQEIRDRLESGAFHDDKETYWIEKDGMKVGVIVMADIADTIPLLYDIRLTDNVRGQGLGHQCITWATDYLFSTDETKFRIEAYTRADNYAMRKVFTKCGYAKEGYLRQSWEHDDGKIYDSVLYAALRSDWQTGHITTVNMNDVPF